jgi:hypothetical protein
MGIGTELDGCEKPRPPAGFESRTVQSVANRCNDYAIPAVKDRDTLICVQRSSSYCAVNTLRRDYKTQSLNTAYPIGK